MKTQPRRFLETNDHDALRVKVRDTLQRTESFRALPPEEQQKLASGVVTVLSYLSDPAAGQPELREVAKALADNEQEPPGWGQASQSAPDVFGRYVDTVDFPKFVAGLIDGVFTSIVNSSIKQMHEFGKFLEGVVKSVDDFAQDNVTPQQARNFLQSKFPGQLQMQEGRLVPTEGAEGGPPDFQSLLGTGGSLDDEEGEKKLVYAAQLKMARMRQQQLSTLVLMGINRIVVTEGEIKASVLFDVKSWDRSDRTAESGYEDQSTSKSKSTFEAQQGGGWFSDPDWQQKQEQVSTRVSTSHARTEGKDASGIEAHAKLSGSVLVKFKSETFPLEKLASSAEIAKLQSNAQK